MTLFNSAVWFNPRLTPSSSSNAPLTSVPSPQPMEGTNNPCRRLSVRESREIRGSFRLDFRRSGPSRPFAGYPSRFAHHALRFNPSTLRLPTFAYSACSAVKIFVVFGLSAVPPPRVHFGLNFPRLAPPIFSALSLFCLPGCSQSSLFSGLLSRLGVPELFFILRYPVTGVFGPSHAILVRMKNENSKLGPRNPKRGTRPAGLAPAPAHSLLPCLAASVVGQAGGLSLPPRILGGPTVCAGSHRRWGERPREPASSSFTVRRSKLSVQGFGVPLSSILGSPTTRPLVQGSMFEVQGSTFRGASFCPYLSASACCRPHTRNPAHPATRNL